MSFAAAQNLQGMPGMPGAAKANGRDVTLGDADAELDFREAGEARFPNLAVLCWLKQFSCWCEM